MSITVLSHRFKNKQKTKQKNVPGQKNEILMQL